MNLYFWPAAILRSRQVVNLDAIYLVGVAEDLIELAIAADDIKKAKKVLADLIS